MSLTRSRSPTEARGEVIAQLAYERARHCVVGGDAAIVAFAMGDMGANHSDDTRSQCALEARKAICSSSGAV
jgi:hypothetical protein